MCAALLINRTLLQIDKISSPHRNPDPIQLPISLHYSNSLHRRIRIYNTQFLKSPSPWIYTVKKLQVNRFQITTHHMGRKRFWCIFKWYFWFEVFTLVFSNKLKRWSDQVLPLRSMRFVFSVEIVFGWVICLETWLPMPWSHLTVDIPLLLLMVL